MAETVHKAFVGDVQGCADELDELVERLEERFGDAFELWLVGDLVNRGPGNLRVLQRVRRLVDAGRARCVLGNHELALLSVGYGLRAAKPLDTFGDVLASRDRDELLAWLRRRPVAVRGELGGHPFAMVHAAVHPSWSLDELERRARRIEARLGGDDAEAARALLSLRPGDDAVRDDLGLFTSCRRIDARGRWASALPEHPGDAWHERWSACGHDYGVVYGHWALQGLHVAPGLRGLDTGCVHHGRGHDGYLTAWLPGSRQRGEEFAAPDDRFLQVRARRRYYYAAGEAAGEAEADEARAGKRA